ncbi:MAG: hypothetical protein Q8R70_09610, partial [Methanoregula sp.]|nr:hypothetical protein [Methanoregula sp.]
SGSLSGKEFGKNSNLSHLLLFFDLLVDWRLIGVDDYPKITEENLEKYWVRVEQLSCLLINETGVGLQS